MVDQPSKSDIESVFHRLRAVPANKECFDCNAKNPTWASITYGIFICIDCSAVHRSLGVHLTFVRSTQLDTNWTWIQLRQMQVGGNANARQFFSQHNCTTTDAQKKYNSRAAQLYREKLQQAAVKAMNNNSGLHIHAHSEEKHDEEVDKEADFFSEHENFSLPEEPVKISTESDLSFAKIETQHPTEGPKVDFHLTESKPTERVSTIGVRKVQPKKSGLGAKRSGLGATKVKTNFADIEKEAVLAEEIRQRNIEEVAKAEALSIKEKEEKEAAFRLAYKDLSNEQHRKEEQLKKADPRKAEQVERLGMGFNTRSGISHSVMSDLKSIEQENVESTTNSLNSLGKLRLSDNDGFFDSFSYSSGFNMNRNSNAASPASRGLEALLASDNEKLKDWTIIDDPVIDKPKSSKSSYVPIEKNPVRNSYPESSSSDMAQKKFGSAKGISSDQFFGDRENDYEVQANLNRFQGSSSISSSEFFGHGSDNASYNKFQTPDLDDVRESVRQGVSKVAGKISSLANGVMSSIQERYGY